MESLIHMHPKERPLVLLQAEIRLHLILKTIGWFYVIIAIAYFLFGVISGSMGNSAMILLLATLATKVGLFAALVFTAGGNVRHSRTAVLHLVLAHFVTFVICLFYEVFKILELGDSVHIHFVPPVYPIVSLSFITKLVQECSVVTPGCVPFQARTILWGSVAIDVLVMVLVYYMQRRTERVQYKSFSPYLAPIEYDVIYAFAEVLITDGGMNDKAVISAADIAGNVHDYIRQFPDKMSRTLRIAVRLIEYFPFRYRGASFSYLNLADRRAVLKKYFITAGVHSATPKSRFYHGRAKLERFFTDCDPRVANGLQHFAMVLVLYRLITQSFVWLLSARSNLGELRLRLGRALIMAVKQLIYLGYYGDARVHKMIHYTPFMERAVPLVKPKPIAVALRVITAPGNFREISADYDVAIIGTGAAAAIIAHELVAYGLNVIMIERGRFIQPFSLTNEEASDSGALYAEAALQTSRNIELQVTQGRCVGGSTVVNNAICIDPPADVLDVWKQKLNGKLDFGELCNSMDAVKHLLQVTKQDKTPLNPSGKLFEAGIQQLYQGRVAASVVDANISEKCVGCGYCNLGCRFGFKLDMLARVLPCAQACGKGKLTIVAECEAIRTKSVRSGATNYVKNIECRMGDQLININAKTFVLSAGAIGSSVFLQRSLLGGPTVGKGLSFNVAAVMSGVVDNNIESFAGLQMSHYLRVPQEACKRPDFILETWYNPPITQSARMPGWFEDHRTNMQNYAKTMSVGVLVGTQNSGQVIHLPHRDSPRRILPWLQTEGSLQGLLMSLIAQSDILFDLAQNDFERLLAGCRLAGEVMLAGGAKAVMLSSFPYEVFRSAAELNDRLIPAMFESSDLLLGSAHPQGGNAMSDDPKQGVVSADFHVHNVDNLFVCDASVFPTSVGVNPQITVMALAHYAANKHIAPFALKRR